MYDLDIITKVVKDLKGNKSSIKEAKEELLKIKSARDVIEVKPITEEVLNTIYSDWI